MLFDKQFPENKETQYPEIKEKYFPEIHQFIFRFISLYSTFQQLRKLFYHAPITNQDNFEPIQQCGLKLGQDVALSYICYYLAVTIRPNLLG